MAESEAPPPGQDDVELNIPPDEVDQQRKRAFVASGLGWGLDGFDWTMFAYALPAITVSLSLSPSDGPFIVAFSLLASAFGGVVGGTLADRFGRVKVLTFVILGYSVFTPSRPPPRVSSSSFYGAPFTASPSAPSGPLAPLCSPSTPSPSIAVAPWAFCRAPTQSAGPSPPPPT